MTAVANGTNPLARSETPPASSAEAAVASEALPTNCSASFLSCWNAPETVKAMPENCWSMSAPPSSSALVTISAVNLPSCAMARSSPRVTPKDLANMSIRIGACSATELNSSPRSAPAAKPCDSWMMAAADSCAVAPETTKALLIVSVMRSVCACVRFSASVERAMRVYSSAVASKDCRVSFAMASVWERIANACCSLSATRRILLVRFV